MSAEQDTSPSGRNSGGARPKLALALALLLGCSLAGWIALGQLEDRVETEIAALAADAGLELTLDEVHISPLGQVEITRLQARRPDGSKALWVGGVQAKWRVLDLLGGRRMPAELRLVRPAVELRLVDGRPVEVRRWLAALRRRLGSPASDGDSQRVSRAGWRGPDAMGIVGGVLRIEPTGRGGGLLTGGLLLADLHVDLVRERGGKLSARLESPAHATLRGRGQVDDEGSMWLTGTFTPALRVPLPGAFAGAEAIVNGVGWSSKHGPHLAGIAVEKDGHKQVRVARVGLAEGKAGGVRIDGVAVELDAGLLDGAVGRAVTTHLGIEGLAGGRLEVASITGRRRTDPTGHRLEIEAREFIALLPAGLGRGVAEELRVVMPQPTTGTLDPGDAVVEITRPGLLLRAGRQPAGSPLASLAALADRLSVEAKRPLASVPEADARLQPGWQRPGTVSVAERRAIRKKQTKGERRAARLEKRARRKARLEKTRVGGAYTARFAGPLRKLKASLLGVAASIAGLDGPGLVRAPQVRIREGSAEVRGKTGRLATTGLDASWLRADDGSASLQVEGRLEAGQARLGRWRLRGDVTEALAVGPIRLDLQGRELARIGRAFWPHLGIGPRPSMHLSLRIHAGTGPQPLQIEGTFRSRDVGLDWRRFSPVPHTDFVVDSTFALRVGAGRRGTVRLDVPEVRLGQAVMRGRVTAGKLAVEPYVDLRLELPKQDCGRVAASIPASLLPTIGRINARGPISWWVDLHLDVLHPYFSELDLELKDEHCQVDDFGSVDVAGLAEPFSRKVNEDGFLLDKVRIGPKSGSWTPLAHMPRWLPYSMTTTEDGSFFSHRGLNPFLLNRAIRLDLHYGRFVYGGSTLTQQLVKNLYMTRSKYLGRKLEELLIVWQMERTLAKSRILEIYANAVEFGPRQYGVTRGAKHYFDKSPGRVTPLEAAWLGSIKPCPACADGHFRARRYGPWYQKRLLEIMTRMHYFGVITQDQYDREMNTVPRFTGWPAGKLARRFNLPIPPRKLNKADLGRRAAEVDEEVLQQEAAERREKMRLRIVEREKRLRQAREDREARKLRLQNERQAVFQEQVDKLQSKGPKTARERRLLARSKRLAAAAKKRALALKAAGRRAAEKSWEVRQREAIAAEKRRREAAARAESKTAAKPGKGKSATANKAAAAGKKKRRKRRRSRKRPGRS